MRCHQNPPPQTQNLHSLAWKTHRQPQEAFGSSQTPHGRERCAVLIPGHREAGARRAPQTPEPNSEHPRLVGPVKLEQFGSLDCFISRIGKCLLTPPAQHEGSGMSNTEKAPTNRDDGSSCSMLAALLGLSTQLRKVLLPAFVGHGPGAATSPSRTCTGRKERKNKDRSRCPEQWKQESPSGLGSLARGWKLSSHPELPS